MKKPPEGATTIGRFHRAEGDPARHKSRCFYYRKSDGWCSERVMTCPGSAYCSHYIEKDDAKFTFVEKCTSEKKEKTASTFQEIKFVDISLINVTPQAQTNKNEKKIRYFATIFNRTGRVEPPIKVSCSGTHYLVEDGNARYFAALGLGIKLIPVVFTERKISNFETERQAWTPNFKQPWRKSLPP